MKEEFTKTMLFIYISTIWQPSHRHRASLLHQRMYSLHFLTMVKKCNFFNANGYFPYQATTMLKNISFDNEPQKNERFVVVRACSLNLTGENL